MPIVFILVSALTTFTIWMADENNAALIESHRIAGAQYVANNIVNYQSFILAHANMTDNTGALVNQTRFAAASADASVFLASCRAAGHVPSIMTWFNGVAPGVSARIVNQRVVMSYKQIDNRYPTERAVQEELLRFSEGVSLSGRNQSN